MKYKKLIIILAVALVLFIGGGLLYSALSENMKNDTVLTGTDDSDITSTTIGITAVTETSDASSASTTDSGNTSATSSTAPAEGVNIGDLAYDFTLKSYEGEEVTLSDYRGKIVLINFWASWCRPCRDEMPYFQTIQDEITAAGSDADVVILSINMTDGVYETKDTAHGYVTANNFTFPLVFDDGNVSSLYEAYYIPETYILDKDGIIIEVIEGSTNLETLNAAVEEARE
mgnify:FL=1